KTIGPWLLIAALIITGFAALTEPIFATILTLSGAGIATGILAVLARDTPIGKLLPFRILRYGLLAQSGYLHGAGRFLFRRDKNLWKRPEVDRLDLSAAVPPPRAIRSTKRVMDVIMATIGLIVFSPVLLIAAIAIKLDTRGPIFYMQERERPGPGGTPDTFRMFKFRSMVEDAEKTTGPIWASQGGKGRVTRVGAFIRKYRIDEIPQFVNVLKGDMSVIGPRPERPFFTRQFETEIPGYGDRVSVVRPGITGWAQVQCPPDSTTDTVRFKVQHDLAYIASLYRFLPFIRMEFRILWRTVGVMLRGTTDE
ncbi:MAG: lipopolysaccharide/colanic/teichoic acid biosynthesis glycosyltransferase, partial [Myxococcota bacterium]